MYDATQIQPYTVEPTPKVETGPTRHPTRAQAYLLFLCVLVLNAIGQTLVSAFKIPFPIEVTLSEVLFILVPVLAFIQIGNFDLRATLHLNPTTPRMLLLSVVVALLAWPLAEVLGFVTDYILQNVAGPLPQLVPAPKSALEAVSYLFVLTVVPGICEEVLNRGVMQRAFERQGLWRTVFYIAIFFALFHLGLYSVLFTFMLGGVLSYVVFKTNSIYNSMVCHAVFNSVTAMLIVLSYFNVANVDENLSWLIPVALVTTPLLIGALYYIGRLTRESAGKEVYIAPPDNSLAKGQFSFAEMALLTVIGVIFTVMCAAELLLRYACGHPELLRQLHMAASTCQQ